MKKYYMYVCYSITGRNDDTSKYEVDFSEMESFRTMKEAVNFCKENYALFVIAVEKCDKEVYESI